MFRNPWAVRLCFLLVATSSSILWWAQDPAHAACTKTLSSTTETIIDDLDGCFSVTTYSGGSQYWYQANSGYAGHTWWTYSTWAADPDYEAHWHFSVDTAGAYDVYAYIPGATYARTSAAVYRTWVAGTYYTSSPISQLANPDRWVWVATWNFPATTTNQFEVWLQDNTGENDYYKIAADALKFVYNCGAGTCSTEGSHRCNASGDQEVCGRIANGCLAWLLPSACPNNQHCDSATGECVCDLPYDCTVGESKCCDGTSTQYSTCVTIQGCPSWNDCMNCPSDYQICENGGNCVCQNECSGPTCASDQSGYYPCLTDSENCQYKGTKVNCAVGEICEGGGCHCPGDSCTSGQTRCIGTTGQQHCENVGSCWSWSTTETCPSGQTCVPGEGCQVQNTPPTITLTSPSTETRADDVPVFIKWSDGDADGDATTVDLYFDNDRDHTNTVGTIALGLDGQAGGGGDSHGWDVSSVPNGRYYIAARISDGSAESWSYAPGSVVVEHWWDEGDDGGDLPSSGATPPASSFNGFDVDVPFEADPINVLTGGYTHEDTDLALHGGRFPLAFTRSYNSQDSYVGPLGPGWTHSFDHRLRAVSGGVKVHLGDGKTLYFQLSAGSYTPMFGSRYELTAEGGDLVLESPEHVTYRFDAGTGNIVELANRNQQTASFLYDPTTDHLSQVTGPDGRSFYLSYDEAGQLIDVALDDGRHVAFGYTSNLLTSITDPRDMTSTVTYAGSLLTSIVMPRGNTLIANVYSNGRVVEQRNGKDLATRFDYDTPSAGDVTVTDPLGRVRRYTFDSKSRLVSQSRGPGHEVSFTYGTAREPLTYTDAGGNDTRFTYDARGNVLSITHTVDGQDETTELTYDASDNLVSSVLADGVTVAFTYDPAGNLLDATSDVGGADEATISVGYGTSGLPTTLTDAGGHVVTLGYDSNYQLATVTDVVGTTTYVENLTFDVYGRLLARTDAENKTWSFTYDAEDRVRSASNPLSETTEWTYDENGRLRTRTNPRGFTTTFTYDANELLTQVDEPLSRTTKFEYDNGDQRSAIIDPRNYRTELEWDALGRMKKVTAPLGQATQFAYDARGLLQSVTEPDGDAVAFSYDELGRVIAVGDMLGRNWTRTYDKRGRLASVSDPVGNTTSFTYNAQGRLLTATDPAENVMHYTYDLAGRLKTVTPPGAGTWTYGYDGRGRLLSEHDPIGNPPTRWVYDGRDKVVSVNLPTGESIDLTYDDAGRLETRKFSGTDEVTYSYDESGNLTGFVDPIYTASYTYDALDQLTSYTRSGLTFEFGYDEAGNRKSVKYGADSREVTYGYNANGQIESIHDWLGGITSYTWWPDGRLHTVTRPNGVTTRHQYDESGALIELTHTDAADDILLSYLLTYDNRGYVSSVDTMPQYPLGVVEETMEYSYRSDGSVAAVNGESATYDQNGRLRSLSGTTFDYLPNGRISHVTTPAGIVELRWDGSQHPAEIIRDAAPTTVWTAPSRRPHLLRTSTNVPVAAQTNFIWGPGLIQQVSDSGVESFPLEDPTGSIVGATNSDGEMGAIHAYEPFGMELSPSGLEPNQLLGFRARDGLLHIAVRSYAGVVRTYSADLAQWTSRDPLRFIGSRLNCYSFNEGNPLRWRDPTSMSAERIADSSPSGDAAARRREILIRSINEQVALDQALNDETNSFITELQRKTVNRAIAAIGILVAWEGFATGLGTASELEASATMSQGQQFATAMRSGSQLIGSLAEGIWSTVQMGTGGTSKSMLETATDDSLDAAGAPESVKDFASKGLFVKDLFGGAIDAVGAVSQWGLEHFLAPTNGE